MIIVYSHGVIEQQVAPTPSAPDERYVTVSVSITPDEAQEMVNTLDSNGSSERATRDPLSRAILEAIQASGIL